ncbi:MAG: hypothetical protein PXY39_00250 [archaeon]|nr:hypothetical protein [archaeon]
MINIRPALVSDALNISKVHIDTWKTTYRGIVPQDYLDNLSYKEREERWIKILTDTEFIRSKKSFTLVAEDEKFGIVGWAGRGR